MDGPVFLCTTQGSVGPSTGLAHPTLGTPRVLGFAGSPCKCTMRRCSDATKGGWMESLLLMVVLNSRTSPFFITC